MDWTAFGESSRGRLVGRCCLRVGRARRGYLVELRPLGKFETLTVAFMSFNTLAPHYRWMEFILAGKKLQRCRTAFFNEVPLADNILLVGEGNGRCLTACLRQFASSQITCIDASEGMLEQARRAVERSGLPARQVRFVHSTIQEATELTIASYDLIVTNFFLDCFPVLQLQQVVADLSRYARPVANWLVADFQTAPSGWRRWRSRLILSLMYTFFRVATRLPARQLTDPAQFLRQAGFVLHRRVQSDWDLLHSDWWRRDEEKHV